MRKIQIVISSDLCISDWHEIWQAAAAATETLWVVSYGGKTIPRWRAAAILKIDMSPYLSKKSSNFDEILYTAVDFELDERHVINNKKVRQNVFLVSNNSRQNSSLAVSVKWISVNVNMFAICYLYQIHHSYWYYRNRILIQCLLSIIGLI